jgi:hypothetical protein
MAKVFECERDGLVICGEDDTEPLANVERRVADPHPTSSGCSRATTSSRSLRRRDAR